jgi:transketolase
MIQLTEKEHKRLKKKANEIRHLILDMCVKGKTGHVTSSYSCTEILTALYYGDILRFDPKNPEWEQRDRFILSKGQASVILYPILADLNFYPKKWLDTFCGKEAKFGVHLQNDVPGVEITAGSLGMGFGIAAGMALTAKMNREHWFTFALLGDGECYEGSIWETAMFASHNHLNNLIAIIDRNWQCATAFTENCVRLEPLDEKWEKFGWEVIRINGHSFPEIFEALKNFRCEKRSKPLCIIADTVKGKGCSFMEHEVLWHSVAPKGEQAIQAKEELKQCL